MFNAANEVAVAAFLAGRLPFLGIAEVVEATLEAADGAPARDLAELVEADSDARRLAGEGVLVARGVGSTEPPGAQVPALPAPERA